MTSRGKLSFAYFNILSITVWCSWIFSARFFRFYWLGPIFGALWQQGSTVWHAVSLLLQQRSLLLLEGSKGAARKCRTSHEINLINQIIWENLYQAVTYKPRLPMNWKELCSVYLCTAQSISEKWITYCYSFMPSLMFKWVWRNPNGFFLGGGEGGGLNLIALIKSNNDSF